jgi:hypothetical protein
MMPDAALAVAIFGAAALDSPEAIDSDNLPGDDAEDDATLQEPFELFFTQAGLQNLGLCKSSDRPAKTSSLAKAAISRKFGIARVEERLIDGTRWAVAFDADGNLLDQQELEAGSLGKRSDGWDDEFVPSTSSPKSDDLHKRATDPKVARIEKTFYPSGAAVVAELDSDNHVIRTYHVEA